MAKKSTTSTIISWKEWEMLDSYKGSYSSNSNVQMVLIAMFQ